MDSGCKRAVLVWHRRSGKDKTVFNFLVKEMFKRVGNYYYFFPTYNQGRKVLWDGKDKDGFPFLSHIPQELRQGDINNTEMKVYCKNGSLLQVVGSDNIDTIVGTNPVGCIFSEYSLQDPRGWDFIRPILRENGGWAVFVYTPRGKNHGWDLWETARKESIENGGEWFVQKLTVDDTFGNGGMVGPEDVELERRSGMHENLIRQEYYCDFDAAVMNAVFGEQIFACRQDGRVTRVPWEPRADVETYWDIGWDDPTAIWFVQQVGREVRFIDYYEARLAGPEHYAKVIREKPYVYSRHVMPHDADLGRMETAGKTLRAIMQEFGINVDIGVKLTIPERIAHARLLFPRCWFDEDKCGKGFDALASWRFEFDEAKKVLSRSPLHNWASHAGDAFTYVGVELRPVQKQEKIKYPSYGYA
jgi:phage terminase large subunit